MKSHSPALLRATGEADLDNGNSRHATSSAEVVPGEHTALDDADKLINNYVHQYLIERGYHQTADCFREELPEESACNIASQTADEANAGFLGDWWMLVQDFVPLVSSAPQAQQTTPADGRTATQAAPDHMTRPLSSSSRPTSTCCEPTERDRFHQPQASVDRLLALSIAQNQTGPSAESRHLNEHTHISPQLLHRSPPVTREMPVMPSQSTSRNKALDRGYHLQVPTVMDTIQTELVDSLAPTFVPPSTPPSPTPQTIAPVAASVSKKRQRAKKPATGAPKAKAATAPRPTKRKRSQTITSRTKAVSEEGGDEGAGIADWSAASPMSSNQSYGHRGSSAHGRHEKLDGLLDSCVRGLEAGTPTAYDDAADAALMAELARYAASCQPATPSHTQHRHETALSSTTSTGLTASLWAQVAAQPGPDFAAVMTSSSIAQPSLMLLPDVTQLAAQPEMSFLECDPSNIISSTSRSSHQQGSTVPGSVNVSRQPAFSVPWIPTEAPLPGRSEATRSSASQVTIGVPLLSGQDTDLDLFPALRDQLLPVARKVKRSGEALLAHDDELAESHEPIYSYFNPAGETTSFHSATPKVFDMPYGEATSSARLQTPGQAWDDYHGDEKHTQRSAQDQSKFQAPVASTSDFTFTPIRASSASHVPRTDSHSSLPAFVTPARPATHSGPPQSHSTAKEVTPSTHHLSRRSISYSIAKPIFPPYESTSHVHAQPGDCCQAEGSVVKQKYPYRLSPEKHIDEGNDAKSSTTSSESFFPLSFAGDDRSVITSATTTTSTIKSSSSPHRQPPLGIPPHCIDIDTGACTGKSRPITKADRQMAAKLQRGMLAQEEAREKMAEYFRPKLKEGEGAAGGV